MKPLYRHQLSKTLLILFLICFFQQTYGQEKYQLNGKIINKINKKAIHHVGIWYPKKSLVLNTGSNDMFKFRVNAAYEDSIILTKINHKPKSVKIWDLLFKNSTIELEPISSKKSPLQTYTDAKDIIKELYSFYQQTKPEFTNISKSYYQENLKFKGKYVSTMGSLGYSIFMKKNKTDTTSYFFFPENIMVSDKSPEWTKKAGKQNTMNTSPSGKEYLYFEQMGPFSEHFEDYVFKNDKIQERDSVQYRTISFKGKHLKGKIYYKIEDYRIISVSYTAKNIWSTHLNKNVKGDVYIHFSHYDNKLFPTHIDANYSKGEFYYFNHFQVIVQKYKELDLAYNDLKELNLYNQNPFIEFNPEIWNSHNLFSVKNAFSVKKDLSSNNKTLFQQFKDNSNKWMNPTMKHTGIQSLSKIKDFDRYF